MRDDVPTMQDYFRDSEGINARYGRAGDAVKDYVDEVGTMVVGAAMDGVAGKLAHLASKFANM